VSRRVKKGPLALIADVHGNAVALEVVLDDIAAGGIEEIVCLGDVASMGPHPADVVRRVRELGCPVVMGNADAFLLDPKPTSDDETMRKVEDIDVWCAEQLSSTELDFIRSFEATVEVDAGRGRTLLCYHGSPRSFDDVIAPTTPESELDELLGDIWAGLFAGGHTHFQMFRRHRDSAVLNPGSVGMAYDRNLPVEDALMAPWAEYAVIERDEPLSVSLKRVSYDKNLVADAVEHSGMPHSDWWAAEWRAV
jgi:predicted phosphodiesterase